ncbi:MAG: hemolysin family protein [Bacteroidetes bacterium]|jgi:putative hemolysin|nr:hemolysin family protein [Bacteroidota bacterium]
MSIITYEILIIVLLTVFNGVFAMSEIAIVSARKARLQQWAEAGDRRARAALDLARSPERFLSTVQIGITLVGVLAGAFGGATVAQHLTAVIDDIPPLALYTESIAVGIVVIAITYLSLIVGELVPKRIALGHPERIASAVARPMRLLSRLASPVVTILSASSNVLLWLFRIRPAVETPVSEEEIRILIRQGTEAGVFHEDEQEMVDRVFRLSARRGSSLMTPRRDLVVFLTTDTPEDLRRKVSASGHAAYPLCEGSLDNVLGVVHTHELLAHLLAGQTADLRTLSRQPLFLPETVTSRKLFAEFRRTEKDTALLLDEFGGLQGLVTATDVLRALLGDVSYIDTPRAVRQSDGSWFVDGMLDIDEFRGALSLTQWPDEGPRDYETVGGLVMAVFGRIPAEGDNVIWDRYQFEVIDMDGLRIDKVRIVPLSGPVGSGGSDAS